ncbi:hypothetical protein FB192DRAFT_1387814 [Mucor lusitanicus]|uniref:Uncharacterized protein n=1 Tax=Mucor circinelloides f. lusitanicus TaxID=29924 RepID=A0A8H4EZV5_MUCCL|nr:hypothetical protein FB192DRAFT_1387814 [Mucor lusitanicus]
MNKRIIAFSHIILIVRVYAIVATNLFSNLTLYVVMRHTSDLGTHSLSPKKRNFDGRVICSTYIGFSKSLAVPPLRPRTLTVEPLPTLLRLSGVQHVFVHQMT